MLSLQWEVGFPPKYASVCVYAVFSHCSHTFYLGCSIHLSWEHWTGTSHAAVCVSCWYTHSGFKGLWYFTKRSSCLSRRTNIWIMGCRRNCMCYICLLVCPSLHVLIVLIVELIMQYTIFRTSFILRVLHFLLEDMIVTLLCCLKFTITTLTWEMVLHFVYYIGIPKKWCAHEKFLVYVLKFKGFYYSLLFISDSCFVLSTVVRK